MASLVCVIENLYISIVQCMCASGLMRVSDRRCWLWRGHQIHVDNILSVAWPTGVQLLVFFCSSVPVVLFDTPGISRCRSQHVSVVSSSLLHHSIYLWFICFTWWSIDELENLHADRTTVCFEPWQKLRARLGSRKTGLSPPSILYWPFQGGTSVVVPYCSCCLCLNFGLSIMLVTYFVNFR